MKTHELLSCLDDIRTNINKNHICNAILGIDTLTVKISAGQIKQDVQSASQSIQEKGGARVITQQENRIKWFEEFYERINNDSPDIVDIILDDMGRGFS